ncbi:uncharacterized protein LY79DRAFT_5736 [Colletotrichum navitas]|uniref:Uncharacterized protein n=1 Tax=Colletotrichum navitas TaxID=681940 RepID=A0AAD8QCG1_9PEZI|nr:uncharacterized protein LY79DRAFT_5736 [Colletotrichum navitas]KAK1600076.1 hypothetical protein LY79DRAFT_5736 [Colletotrichum navitas]
MRHTHTHTHTHLSRSAPARSQRPQRPQKHHPAHLLRPHDPYTRVYRAFNPLTPTAGSLSRVQHLIEGGFFFLFFLPFFRDKLGGWFGSSRNPGKRKAACARTISGRSCSLNVHREPHLEYDFILQRLFDDVSPTSLHRPCSLLAKGAGR